MSDPAPLAVRGRVASDTEKHAAGPVAGSTDLLVCITCRTAGAPPTLLEDAPRTGAVLAQRLARAALPPGVRVVPVECLSNCNRGCTIALRGGDRWTYVYGDLNPDTDLDALIAGAARYHASKDGLVPWRERPEHFRKHCIARIPPLSSTQEVPHV